MSALKGLHTLAPRKVWDGVIGRVVNGERLTMAVIELAPDSVVPDHRHDNEQLGIVLEGSLTFTIGGETRQLGPGDTWRILSNVPHSVRTGPKGAVVIDVFAPVRADWASLERLDPCAPKWPGPT